MSTDEIYNHRRVSDLVSTGGHPTASQLREAAAEGFEAVVNLAPIDHRSVPDEGELVQSLGIAYHHIPVDWAAPSLDDFDTFEQTMRALEGMRVLVHCAANFRVTAFYSLYAQRYLGWSADEATALRDTIWAGSDLPVWDAFIASIPTPTSDQGS